MGLNPFFDWGNFYEVPPFEISFFLSFFLIYVRKKSLISLLSDSRYNPRLFALVEMMTSRQFVKQSTPNKDLAMAALAREMKLGTIRTPINIAFQRIFINLNVISLV